jgi:uncharacterized protein
MPLRWRWALLPLLVLAAAVAAFFPLRSFIGSPSFSDPASARCTAPPVAFGPNRVLSDHREVDVHFTCQGVVIAGTLTLPKGAGPHPAVLWVHGAGKTTRYTWGASFVQALVRSGLAVLSYDKRGVGESQGECCPGDYGYFNLLTADIVGAVHALRSRSDIDPKQIGLIGASQAGWIVPRAAVESRVAFTALASAGILTYGEVKAYAQLTGGDESAKPRPSKEEISRRLKEAGPSGFDPVPFLKRMTMPALWLYGGADKEVPPDQSVALLQRLKETMGKAFTVVVYPKAGHGLLDVPPTDPRALPTLVRWVRNRVHVPST